MNLYAIKVPYEDSYLGHGYTFCSDLYNAMFFKTFSCANLIKEINKLTSHDIIKVQLSIIERE